MEKPNRGAVAAGHPLTAEAGAEMLRQGGNAFDAAVAAVFTACVTESVLTSVAGGGFLLAHTASGEDTLFDFFTQTPRSNRSTHSLDFYPIEADFGDATQEFHIGLGSMAVPGNLAGLIQIQRQLGRLPLSAVVEPAIHWARQGVVLDQFRTYCLELLAPILTATTASRSIYAPQGQLLRLGDRLRMPEFANTLEALLKQGPDLFYYGDLAHQLARDCHERGGYLSLADLQHYRVVARTPLRVRYRDVELVTNPPPSSGGTLIAFALQLLAQADLSRLKHGAPSHIALLVEAMRLTNQARRDGYDQNLYQQNIADWFLSESHLAHYRHDFQATVNKWGSTTHISVLDSEGNAASVTTSNGEGSSYVIPGTQIMVNNMLGEEDLNPQGFHRWLSNQRMSSMMAPTLVLQQGRPRLVLGSGGSNRIRTAILQVISNLLDFQMDLAAAVEAPRIHWERGMFHLEPGFDQAALVTQGIGLTDELIWWQQPNMFFGGVHAVATDQDGQITGAGDARRGGAIAQV